MNTTKPEHTPTPWYYEQDGDGPKRYWDKYICANDGAGRICTVNSPNGAGVGEVESNARFIVTACNAYDENQRTIAELRKALGDIVDANNAYGDVIGGKLLAQALAALERSKP